MSAGFTPGPIELRIVNPDARISIDGFSDGVFGIDPREYEDDLGDDVVHTITHLRTGGVVCHVKGPLQNAEKVAAILHKAKWDFDNPADCKADGRSEVAKEAKATGLCVPSWNVSLPDHVRERLAKARGES